MKTNIIWLEGSIASGKTTFARKLGEQLGYKVLEEPVESNPFLKLFYKEPSRWAFAMQIYLLHYRYAMKQEASYAALTGRHKGIIIDRSIAGDRVFAKLHRDAGNISEMEWLAYEHAYDVLACTIQPPTLLLYLDCQPETCLRRLRTRGRDVECEVDPDYLRRLRSGYEDLLAEIWKGTAPWNHSIQIQRILWDTDIRSDEEWKNIAVTVDEACKRR